MKYLILLSFIACTPMTVRERRKEEFKDCVTRFYREGMTALEAEGICRSIDNKKE